VRNTLLGLLAALLALAGPAESAAAGLENASTAAAPAPATRWIISGKVAETIDVDNYTYIYVDTGKEKVWAAAPRFKVEVGNSVELADGVPMTNYYSQTLDRTFDVVHFVTSVSVEGVKPSVEGLPPGHNRQLAGSQAKGVDLSDIARAEGGKTVGEIFDAKRSLSGQQVSVRGAVVKFTPGVMGKNWIHLRDGTSSAEGSNDVTITTNASVAIGDIILVRGRVAIDKDFGFGYRYDLLVEDAQITVE
jgi:hypothetical protein